jgi:hypothetical protein
MGLGWCVDKQKSGSALTSEIFSKGAGPIKKNAVDNKTPTKKAGVKTGFIGAFLIGW